MNYTKGPWGLRRDPCHFYTATTIEAGVVGARRPFMPQMVVQVGGDADLLTQEANARLISAAPDLLESLIEAIEYFDGNDEISFSGESLSRARNAVKKAIGIEPMKEKKE